MLFTIKNKKLLSTERLRTNTLLNAYYVIKNYPLNTTELIMDQYLQQRYNISLKNMCIKLLLNLTSYEDNNGDIILLFKNLNYDAMASLITYGNGAIPGSSILKTALSN